MRTQRALTAGAALIALTGVAGCGGGDDDGGASTGDDRSSASGLPKAADLASVASYLNEYTSCQDLTAGAKYDAGHQGDGRAWGTDEAADPSWAIKERGVCTDRAGRPVVLLVVSDMTKFQTAVKKDGSEFLVGEDFAVVPVGDETVRSLQGSGLRFLTCDADFSAPSGAEKKPGLVDGCVLTDHLPG
ncbi:hypothetical protein [Streptomyces sp. NPDC002566]|uniref:hypothetical protein n=1 Tax=Streptomyces sp. NPDC002566 TaxID=3364650 RepID=UPI0036B14768